MKDILLTKSDELTWGVRQFMEQLKKWLKKNKAESFTGKELRKSIRIAPSTLIKYIYILRQYGLVEILGGSRHRGYKYMLTKGDDYQIMSKNLDKV